jgi:alpha-galactosidase
MKRWLARLVRDYQVDWLKWDNNIWMSCDPIDQPGSANYAHINGLYEVLDFLRAEFPHLIIENCASGGNRMDYALMRRTDIAWLSDETDPSYRVRYHLFGASRGCRK